MNNISWGKRRATLGLAHLLAIGVTLLAPWADALAQTAVTTWGIIAPFSVRSSANLGAAAARLDALVADAIQLDSITGLPSRVGPDTTATPRATASVEATRMALVTSWQGQRFHPEMIRRISGDRGALALTAARIASLASSNGYHGLVIDVEGQSREDLPLTVRLVGAIADSARRHGVTTIAIALPAADTMGYPTRAFLPLVDYVMIMLIDEHRPSSGPGAVASPEWIRRQLAQRVADVGAARLVAALPLYSYLWRQNQPASMLSFNDARHAAAESAVDVGRDPASQSLHAVKPGDWDLWMTDAALVHALRDAVRTLGVTHVALWGLGLEDPALWTTVPR